MKKPENTINMGGAPISLAGLELALKMAEEHGEVHIVGVSTLHKQSLMSIAAVLMAVYERTRNDT